MSNFIVHWMKCHGTETPPFNAPRVELLRPMTSELQSLQKIANEARRQQMSKLINHEKASYDIELRTTLGKSFVSDDVCDRRLCMGEGGRQCKRCI